MILYRIVCVFVGHHSLWMLNRRQLSWGEHLGCGPDSWPITGTPWQMKDETSSSLQWPSVQHNKDKMWLLICFPDFCHWVKLKQLSDLIGRVMVVLPVWKRQRFQLHLFFFLMKINVVSQTGDLWNLFLQNYFCLSHKPWVNASLRPRGLHLKWLQWSFYQRSAEEKSWREWDKKRKEWDEHKERERERHRTQREAAVDKRRSLTAVNHRRCLHRAHAANSRGV